MFTQCPECDVAFRVTAEVLRQAAGKVRCGGCGVAFNALLHLSEEMPGAVSEEPKSEPEVPELTPDEPAELEAGTPPKSISAEQSAALLKTLDQLAGEDVRIEDTGVEWRVLDPDENNDVEPFADDVTDTGVHEEMRFDDNTPLPEDFDLDAPSAPPPEPVVEIAEPTPSIEDSQVDLAFGAPDEWEDLLEDLQEAAANVIEEEEPPAAEEPATEDAFDEDASENIELVADNSDDTDISEELAALPDVESIKASAATDEPLDMDTQFAIQAEAMGIDISGIHSAPDVEDAAEDDVAEDNAGPEADLELESETSIDEDLIAAAFEAEAAAKAKASIAESLPEIDEDDEVNVDELAPEELSRAGILDEDDYLEVIEEEVAEEEPAEEPEPEPEDAAELEEPPEVDLEAQLAELELVEAEPEEEEDATEAETGDVEEVDEIEEPEASEAEEADETEEAAAEADEVEEPEDEAAEAPSEEEIEAELEQAFEDFVAEDDSIAEPFENFAEPEIPEIPEPTEEEKTINMMIDQDLLAIAVEDDDGFTSTIVQRQVSSNDDIPPEKTAEKSDLEDTIEALESSAPKPAAKSGPLVETIIMEGNFAHREEDLERRVADRQAASVSLKKSGFDDDNGKLRNWEPPRYGMIAAAVLLVIILIVQVLHQSREAFATSPTFQRTLGPIYRMVGSPVTPAWDIKGWRFEATKGSTDEDNKVLTIYSRIGNTSEQPLPYPLVHVSLTDRFEEIIGSRVLEPAEYLSGNADPRRAVPNGENFDAVFTIDSPSVDATGFKLNVCYRQSTGQLRCAIEDFK